MDELKRIELRIDEGPVVVNGAVVIAESPNIVCIEIDFASKYAETVTWGENDEPMVGYGANERTLGLDTSKEGLTMVYFPEYAGWEVFTAGPVGRYTASVVLRKKAE